MLPDEKVMCHRTGFTKTCFECVVTHKCRLWKNVKLEGDPRLPEGATQSAVDHWDCADSLSDLYLRDMLRRQLQTTATVDKLAKEVNENNQGSMRGFLTDMNHEVRRLQNHSEAPALPNGAQAPKLLEG